MHFCCCCSVVVVVVVVVPLLVVSSLVLNISTHFLQSSLTAYLKTMPLHCPSSYSASIGQIPCKFKKHISSCKNGVFHILLMLWSFLEHVSRIMWFDHVRSLLSSPFDDLIDFACLFVCSFVCLLLSNQNQS